MPESVTPRSPLSAALESAQLRTTVTQRDGLTMAHIAARKGRSAALRAALEASHEIALPGPGRASAAASVTAVWNGIDSWLLLADRASGRDLETELRKPLAGLASVSDASDARVVCRVSGKRVRDVLATGIPIDLHPQMFSSHAAAITHANHVGILIWRGAADDTFDIAVARSYATNIWDWLVLAGSAA